MQRKNYYHISILGKRLPKEIAIDICIRTDKFLMTGIGSGDFEWESAVIEALMATEEFEASKADRTEFLRALKHVNLSGMANDWVSSPNILGPSGWCSPSGIISFNQNMGPFDGLAGIVSDLKKIAFEWPQVSFSGTVYDEDAYVSVAKKNAILTFRVDRGLISINEDRPGAERFYHPDVQVSPLEDKPKIKFKALESGGIAIDSSPSQSHISIEDIRSYVHSIKSHSTKDPAI